MKNYVANFNEKKNVKCEHASASEALVGASSEYTLVPITVAGVVVPSRELGPNGWQRGFRLACASGVQYVIEAGTEWTGILSRYKWEEVKVVGLFNKARMAIILQKLFPVGPNGSGLSMVEFAVRGARKITREVFGVPGGLIAACAGA